ncbi:MAG: cytochrome c oxidase subunit II [Chloroflexota bacterium]|nr:cytochrome c oxidase subunit II [Chloroflexota bacterium]
MRLGTIARFGVLLAALAAVAVLFVAFDGNTTPYTTISPRTESAEGIQDLYTLLFWAALVVFVLVQAAIVYTVLRFRRRSETEPRPAQIHGNKTLEIAWTVIPAAILLAILIPTIVTMYEINDAVGQDQNLIVEVHGKQWWWEIHYPGIGVVTANEVHIPQDQPVQFNLKSDNVIHSFWVPQLAGKRDVIPGHITRIAFTAPYPGVYYGECAEFCGRSHAWMRFRVIVEPREQFEAWVASWKQGPTQGAAQSVNTGDITRAPREFGVCLGCHRINGVRFLEGSDREIQPLPTEADATPLFGPNLSLFGCRATIGAGILTNTPDNLELWIANAPAVKPGSWMPAYGESEENPNGLTEEQIERLVVYLESLQPEGGCYVSPDVGEPDLGIDE